MTNLNENYRVSFIHVVLRQEEIFVLPKHTPAHALTIQIKTTWFELCCEMQTRDWRCVFNGLESRIGVLEWSHGLGFWSGFVKWDFGGKFWSGTETPIQTKPVNTSRNRKKVSDIDINFIVCYPC